MKHTSIATGMILAASVAALCGCNRTEPASVPAPETSRAAPASSILPAAAAGVASGASG